MTRNPDDSSTDWPAERAGSVSELSYALPSEQENPMIDWNALLDHLGEPFSAAVIKYRVGAVTKDRQKAQGLAVADCRAYEDRLPEVVPGGREVGTGVATKRALRLRE